MSLAPGVRFGSYEILSALGAGGMGEVYRARDTRLNRDVAVKVLPELFAVDSERVARFQREAQLLASLNHPNIAHIHGLEEVGTRRALVLELVDGPTLGDLIAKGPIPVDEALAMARQICEALEAAHEHAIVHRDLKPANIKLTSNGTVKVLDFGLAKTAAAPDAGFQAPDVSMSPTITSPAMTMGGMILGTAAYMSPEQAKGKPLDKRTDIWAFGCVLFEMLAGSRAFVGDDVSDTMAAILRGEPDWSALPATTPAPVVRVLKRCLEKDRKQRIADIADARYELNADAISESRASATAGPRSSSSRYPMAMLMFGLLVGAGIAAALLSYFAPVRPMDRVARFTFSPPQGWELWAPSGAIGQSPLAVSSDGSHIAFVARQPGQRGLLWVRSMEALDAKMLPGTEGATSPFWSPDGASIGFFADGKLKRVDVTGGMPTPLADAPNERGGAWSERGVIVFAPTLGSPLQKIPATGGTPTQATAPGAGDPGGHARPAFLPDGNHFVYRQVVTGGATRSVFVASLEGAAGRKIMDSESGDFYYSKGHLLFLRAGALVAQAFDPSALALSGEPFLIADGINGVGNANVFAVSTNGVIVYQRGTQVIESQLQWVDRRGTRLANIGEGTDLVDDLELSPDQKRLAVTLSSRASPDARDVWILDTTRGIGSKATSDPNGEFPVVWGVKGDRIYYSRATGSGPRVVHEQELSVGGAVRPIGPQDGLSGLLDAGPTGELLFQYSPLGGRSDLWVAGSADSQPRPLMETPFAELRAKFSPDGRWIAYMSDRSGTLEVYVTSFPKPREEVRISAAGGRSPRWHGNSREIYYLAPDNKVMAVEVDGSTSEFKVGKATSLFEVSFAGTRSQYDVTEDGQRFVVNALPRAASQEPITVVLNWAPAVPR